MFTVIIPIDFSAVSDNAIRYAIGLKDTIKDVHYVFYHSTLYQEHILDNNTAESFAEKHISSVIADSTSLESFSYKIIINDDYVDDSVKHLSESMNASLIIMGIRGKNKLEQKFIGSNTLAIAKKIDCPVLIIPGKAQYKGIKNIGIAIPFNKDTIKLVPYLKIRNIVEQLKANLHIISVEPIGNAPQHIVFAGENAVHHMFNDINPQYQIYQSNDIVRSILRSAEEEHLDIISTIAEEHNFWERVVKSSVTSALAFNHTIPLLVFSKEKK